MNLNFIIVYVNDLEKSKAFYTEALGMTHMGAVSSTEFATMRPSEGGSKRWTNCENLISRIRAR